MRNLPDWKLLSKHYPAADAKMVAEMVGGKVKLNYTIGVFSNFCAIRISRALNLAGHPIPHFKDVGPRGKQESQVSSGHGGAWHIFRVRQLLKYLERQYGKPATFSPDEYKKRLDGRTGIIVFEVRVWSDASGHADLWDGKKCLWKGYGDVASKVMFWPAD